VKAAVRGGEVDAVVFTSSSTVRNLVALCGKPHDRTLVACIGPQTAAAAREAGLRVDVESKVASVAAVTKALADFVAAGRTAALEAAAAPAPAPRKAAAKKAAPASAKKPAPAKAVPVKAPARKRAK
jgi:uroporphyrinogen III methyltransferase/synthase